MVEIYKLTLFVIYVTVSINNDNNNGNKKNKNKGNSGKNLAQIPEQIPLIQKNLIPLIPLIKLVQTLYAHRY